MRTLLCLCAIFLFGGVLLGQVGPDSGLENQELDSLYIDEVEYKTTPHKNLHAEPLYIDLIRDLGARKGEREWNVAGGLTDKSDFDEYEVLVEYEWAPVNRLGLEVELPLTFYTKNKDEVLPRPSHRVEGIKTAIQWSFWVHDKSNMTLALGYLNEVQFADLNKMSIRNVFRGNAYNPFVVAAKRWGNNFHSLIYTGPIIEQEFGTRHWHWNYAINTSFHYMITGTRNFVGVEFNKEIEPGNFDMVIRPQMRVAISEQLLVGIVGGIPISKSKERLSTFVRLIYEPHGKQHK